jgi:NNP family nitrate/nitrite transporter-like MFS transporter
MRFLLGPLCDKVGPRVLFMAVLCFASIPTGCTGFVDSANGLIVLRLFIGVAGGSFVMCQYWTSRMFTKEVVGTANALVGGWGNLGGGVTQIVMGTALFPLFKEFFKGTGSPEEIATSAWRHVCIVPAIVAFFTGIMVFLISDDAPKGNFNELKRHGTMAEVSAAASFRSGACNFNTWILFVQYGCCFGVELTMNNAAALYFHDKFDLTTENAAAAASIFGWMNLFARGLGGWSSDIMNKRMGMKGRLLTQLILLLIEGALVLVFAQSDSLGEALAVMVFFSMFVQAAEGSTYAIVPYVDPPATGSIAGIVGAGGNVGAVGFGMAFRQLDDDKDAFIIMGCVILVFALTTVLITVKGHRGILFGKDTEFPKAEAETLTVPVPNKEDKVEVTSA